MRKKYMALFFGAFILLGLYLTSLYSYLLFHSVVEIFSILIAFCIFVIAWNSKRFLDNNYFLFIGIAFLFVGAIDLLHTLAYKGMGVFHGYDANLPTQLWIAGRYVQSLSLFMAPLFLGRRVKLNLVLAGYTVLTFLLLGAVFYWDIFPDCFIEGAGLTLFKKVSEYVICLILLASMVLLYRKRKEFDPEVLRLLFSSVLLTIGSELAFTLYIDVYGFFNLIGHFLKVVSYYLIYKALIETGLKRPYDLLFRNLKQSEEELRRAKDELEIKVAERTKELRAANEQLRFELTERKRAEEALRRSAEEIRDLYNHAPCGYHSLNKDGLFTRVNDTELQWLGYTREEVVGKMKFTDFLADGNLKTFENSFPRLKTEGSVHDIEVEMTRRDGTTLPVLLSATALRDSEGNYVMSRSTMFDMTERKQAEKVLRESEKQLRHLSSQLLMAQEMERKGIAREIHDGLGQSLNLIKHRVEKFLNEISMSVIKTSAETLEGLIPMIQGSIEEARRIQMGLRPSILDDLGILATLNWFCREFERTYSNIRINRQIDIAEAEVPVPLRTVVYRITQEALNNISKYSKADLVHLSLGRSGGRIELMIQDNGQGFDLAAVASRQGSSRGLGLTSMKERAELSGGSFRIESGKGNGTTITATWGTLSSDSVTNEQ